METINSILDIAILALLIFAQYRNTKKIHQLNVDNDFALSAIEQLEARVIQNEKKKK